MLTPLHNVIDREENEKYFFLPHVAMQNIHSWQRAPQRLISHSEKAKGRLRFVFSVV